MAFDLSEEELAKTEEEIGARFPDSYRDAMKAHNGGSLEIDEEDWQLFPIRDTSAPKRLSRSTNHVILETRNARKWRGFPELAWTIAGNGAGDHLVIFKTGRAFDSGIFFWRHEDGSLTLLASDFAELKTE